MIPWKVSIHLFCMFSVTIYLKKNEIHFGDINVLTRVQANIAKQIYNIVYFYYYFLSYLNINNYFLLLF